MPSNKPDGEFLLYTTEDGITKLEVRLVSETIWLSQKQLAELFQKDLRTINEHIRNIFKEAELLEDAVIRNFRITASDGKIYNTSHYNLDVIISVGYRVKSHRVTKFRIWANARLKAWCWLKSAGSQPSVVKDFVTIQRIKSLSQLLLAAIASIPARGRREYFPVGSVLASMPRKPRSETLATSAQALSNLEYLKPWFTLNSYKISL